MLRGIFKPKLIRFRFEIMMTRKRREATIDIVA